MTQNQHRGGLASAGIPVWPQPGLLQRVGGRERLHSIVDGLYDRIASDPELMPMFGGRAQGDHQHQKMFFEEWMGGEPRYSRHVKTLGTRLLHYRFGISRRTAGRWLRHLALSLRDNGVDQQVVREIAQQLGPMAHALINGDGPPLPPAVRVDLAALRQLVQEDPEVLKRCSGAARQRLFQAARQGRLEWVQFLVEHGVDLNLPFLHQELMLTPWCIATLEGHRDVAEFLLSQGAISDVFSAARVGDLKRLKSQLAASPESVNAEDPAMDHLAITPLHHAVWGEHLAAAELLLAKGAKLGANSTRLVHRAAELEHLPLVRLLLENGADATRLEPGSWVLSGELTELLLDHGARVDQPANAWLRFCNSQLGQRDEPELIAALLHLGADLSATDGGRGPLHIAANAGHVGTLAVLLEHGAEVHQLDADGETPLAHVLWAVKRADRLAAARVLLEHGADPQHANRNGATPLDRAKNGRRPDSQALWQLLARYVR